jgi:homoserine kinase
VSSSIGLEPGVVAKISVPASSANLGPGFDCLGIALDLRDEYQVIVLAEQEASGVVVKTVGESADEVSADDTHLVAKSFLAGLAEFGVTGSVGSFEIQCVNRIPHGRGLGSSAAAIVGGVQLAAVLAGITDPQRVLQVATTLEGHPDNAAASLMGGFVISWMDGSQARAVQGKIHPGLRPIVFIPDFRSPTAAARLALPDSVAHRDAAFNAARSALLVHAISQDPRLLFEATEDRLHQSQRRTGYPEAMRLVDRLRQQGHAAVISGAGPSVLVLADLARADAVSGVPHEGFRCERLSISPGVSV